MKFNIAVVQFETIRKSPKENLQKAEQFIKKAASSHANIIVFPENFIAGSMEEQFKYFSDSREYCTYFQRLAKKYAIDIVPGSLAEKSMSNLYNTAYYIDAEGKIRSRYRKIHLWHPEKPVFRSGKKVFVFDTRYGKVGLIICWDLFFPEMFRKMLKMGVSTVICPSYWSYGDAGKGLKYNKNSEATLIDSLCIGRAFENEIIFVYCGAVGKIDTNKKQDLLIGHSQITVPFKGVLKKFDHNREQMFVQEVDTAILDDAEHVYRVKTDLS
ncbi:MAG: carbon-nitrogen hydrolase family protein [Parcubacteria group bacterium]|jgi:predicted amidohydrolase